MNRLIKYIFAAKNVINIIKKTVMKLRNREIMIDDLVSNYEEVIKSIDKQMFIDTSRLRNSCLDILKNILNNYEIKNYIYSNMKTDINDFINSSDNKLTELITNEFKKQLHVGLPYEDEYFNVLFLFKRISAKNLTLVDLNLDIDQVNTHQDNSSIIRELMNDYSAKILDLEGMTDLYIDIYSLINNKPIDRSRVYKNFFNKINSSDAENKFKKEMIPLMSNDLDNLLKSFISVLSNNGNEATNKLSSIDLNPILSKYSNQLNKWLINYIQSADNVQLDRDILVHFNNLKLDSISIINTCNRLLREIKRYNMRRFQKLADITPIEVKLLGTDTKYKKGDSFYVKGLGIKKRDLAIVDYGEELVRGLNHNEHHGQIMNRYDPDKTKMPLAWLEEYNDVIVVVALFGNIDEVKSHCLSEGYKKVVYYDPSDSLPDNNGTNKVILARRLFRKYE